MCLTCGCNEPNNRHGAQANITEGDLKQATQTASHAAGTGTGQAHQAMGKTLRRGRRGKTRD